MKILILGSAGRIGRLLAGAFPGHRVLGTRRPEVDLRDRASVERAVAAFDPDAVLLAAGIADPDFCEDHPGDAYAVNVDGARNAAEVSVGRRFVFFSTDHVFDGRGGPYSEEDRPGPLNVYGRTKLEAERIVRTVHPGALVVRTTLVYHYDPGGRNFLMTLLRARSPVPCWTDHRATYTYGPNLAEAVAELVERGERGIWHVAGPEVLDRYAFALRVAARFGLDPGLFRPVRIREAPPRAPRPLRAGLRTDKARAALRVKLLSVDEGLELAYRVHERHPR